MAVSNSLNCGQVDDQYVPQKYRDVVAPHVQSFDDFVEEGIGKALASIEPVRVRSSTPCMCFAKSQTAFTDQLHCFWHKGGFCSLSRSLLDIVQLCII